jgi:16S rRNA (cytidine1402-2'-O)-methyltransferase
MPLPSIPSDNMKTGTLYVVSTPIGNLDDMTLRALNVLKAVDIIAAEDTRHTKKLLAHYTINKPLFALHDHNERERSGQLLSLMQSGQSVALVSDAGTPSVSDPGFRLVRLSVEEGVAVVPIPGVSAAITALSVSGLPTDSFVFLGFPPRKKGKRHGFLEEIQQEKKTLIFYESPHRIMALLDDMIEVFGERNAVLCREMTKLYEEFIRGSLLSVREILKQREMVRGECTLIVSGADEQQPVPIDLDDEIQGRLQSGDSSPSSLAKELSVKYAMKKQDIYEKIMAVRKGLTPPPG